MFCNNNSRLLTKRDLALPTHCSCPDGVMLSTQLLYSQSMRQPSPLKPSGTEEEGEGRKPAPAAEPGAGEGTAEKFEDAPLSVQVCHSPCSMACMDGLPVSWKPDSGENQSPSDYTLPEITVCCKPCGQLPCLQGGFGKGSRLAQALLALLHMGGPGLV